MRNAAIDGGNTKGAGVAVATVAFRLGVERGIASIDPRVCAVGYFKNENLQMMNILQQIIDEMNADILSAEQKFKRKSMHGFSSSRTYEGAAQALKKYVPKLVSFLKSAHESNHKDFADCANTRLGECAAPLVESSTIEEAGGERLSETGIVRQNEQAKEVCPMCTGGNLGKANGKVFCFDCNEWL